MKPVHLESAYQAAHSGAIVVDRSSLGYLRFSGETRLDLLNRMSTQKVDMLEKGQGAATVLTTDIGRINDRLIVYADEDAVYSLTGAGNNDNVARYLMRFVFYMDDFQIQDLSSETAILGLYGSDAGDAANSVQDDSSAMQLHHWRRTEIEGVPISIHRSDPIAGDGFFIICQSSEKSKILSNLLSAGVVLAGTDAFEYLRIESGVPLLGRELTLDYISLEAGLRPDISFNKGCYIGQEIIARMDSRGKLAKKLVKLIPSAPIEAGSEIAAGDKSAGSITSAADGPNGPLALGYIKSAHLDSSLLTVDAASVSIVELAN
jgi:aminomethyltransferase